MQHSYWTRPEQYTRRTKPIHTHTKHKCINQLTAYAGLVLNSTRTVNSPYHAHKAPYSDREIVYIHPRQAAPLASTYAAYIHRVTRNGIICSNVLPTPLSVALIPAGVVFPPFWRRYDTCVHASCCLLVFFTFFISWNRCFFLCVKLSISVPYLLLCIYGCLCLCEEWMRVLLCVNVDMNMCVCVCVCVCVCIYIYIYIYWHTYTHTYIHTNAYTCIHTYLSPEHIVIHPKIPANHTICH